MGNHLACFHNGNGFDHEQPMGSKLSILFVIASVFCGGPAQAATTNFLAAADFSHLAYFESKGVKYRDGGQIQDGLQILKNHGINCVRLRLFTSSAAQASADPYNYINNTNYTVPLAVRVKNAGLLFCLDFHYSDTWADPGHQATPAAWASLTFAQMVQQMRTYNSNSIATFAAAGAMPDYVQIGNEITGGMVWTNGQLSGTWNSSNPSWIRLGQLMKAAVQGVQDASTAMGVAMPQIIVHIDRGGDWNTTKSYFENLNAQGVPYDIIGESYYPFYHGSPTSLNICLSNAAVEFGKPIIVAETAFPYTNTCPSSWLSQLFGYPPTRDGQVSFITALAKVVKSVPNQLGAGVFYWGTEYQAVNGVNEAGFNTASFFDDGGNVMPVASAVGGMAAPLLINATLTNSNLQLQWPFSGAASKLTSSTDLSPSTVWSPVTNSVQITGTVFSVTLPITNNSRFYRLQ
jgi:arabinogalactan endo-1,4-beta-galactosidase